MTKQKEQPKVQNQQIPYNRAFFRSIENSFLTHREMFGEQSALFFLSKLMERSLSEAYIVMGVKENGGVEQFKRCVGERDAAVGLNVEFSQTANDHFEYRFNTDPFPGLKSIVDKRELDETYMKFKVNFFLGPDWSYITREDIWHGDKFTRHVIFQKKGTYDLELLDTIRR